MIFTPEHCDMILRGEKTQTRRVAKAGDYPLCYNADDSLRLFGDAELMPVRMACNMTGRGKWHVGKDYALQPGRGKAAVGRIRITDIYCTSGVQCIHDDEIIAEGYSSIAEYARVWDSINTRKGTRWADNPAVWVLTFEAVEEVNDD